MFNIALIGFHRLMILHNQHCIDLPGLQTVLQLSTNVSERGGCSVHATNGAGHLSPPVSVPRRCQPWLLSSGLLCAEFGCGPAPSSCRAQALFPAMASPARPLCWPRARQSLLRGCGTMAGPAGHKGATELLLGLTAMPGTHKELLCIACAGQGWLCQGPNSAGLGGCRENQEAKEPPRV